MQSSAFGSCALNILLHIVAFEQTYRLIYIGLRIPFNIKDLHRAMFCGYTVSINS